ncbi:DMT family transporter, partial [Fibrobacterota bacterium]
AMKLKHLSQSQLGFMAVVISSLLFSAKGILIKKAFAWGIEPVVVMALRMLFSLPLFAGLALFEGLRVRRKNGYVLNKRDWVCLLGLGLLGYYLASLFDLIGLQYVSAGMEKILLYTHPTFVILLSALLFRRKLDYRVLPAFALCYGGIVMAFWGDLHVDPDYGIYGALMIIICSIMFAVFLIGNGVIVHRVGPNRMAAYGMMISSAAVMVHFLWMYTPSSLMVPARGYLLAAVLAVFATFIPVNLLAYGLKLIGPNQVAILGGIGPVATIFLGWMVLSEAPAPLQVLGMALVVAGGIKLGMKNH